MVAVGIGLREPYIDDLLALEDVGALDVLEVMIDEVLVPCDKRKRWRKLGARWPLIAHGTELGIADAEGLRPDYVRRVADAARDLHVHWYSEHLAFLRAGGVELGHFGPFFDDDESYAVLAQNAQALCRSLPCPLLLENPADILGWANDDAEPAARLGRAYGRALEAAECGALLDLTNLIYNARNEGYDALAFVETLDMQRVVQVHLAGGRTQRGLWIDSHDRPVDAEAVQLLVEVARRAPQLRAVIIERDDRLPDLPVLLEEVAQVRAALEAA